MDSCDSKGLKTIAPEGPSFKLLFWGFEFEGLKRFDAHPTDRLAVGWVPRAGDTSVAGVDAPGVRLVIVVARGREVGLCEAAPF